MSIESRGKWGKSSMEEAFDELEKFGEGKSVIITKGGKFGNFILKEGVRGTITKIEDEKVTVLIDYFGTKAELEIPKSKLKVSF